MANNQKIIKPVKSESKVSNLHNNDLILLEVLKHMADQCFSEIANQYVSLISKGQLSQHRQFYKDFT